MIVRPPEREKPGDRRTERGWHTAVCWCWRMSKELVEQNHSKYQAYVVWMGSILPDYHKRVFTKVIFGSVQSVARNTADFDGNFPADY